MPTSAGRPRWRRSTTLEAYLRSRAIPHSKFIAAGKKLVGLRPGTLLGDDPVLSGDPLRERVLPAYEKARKRLKKQDTPKGSELLQLDLMTYANDIISMTKDGAKKIDEQKAFFFQLGDRPVELFQRLAALENGDPGAGRAASRNRLRRPITPCGDDRCSWRDGFLIDSGRR